VKNTVESKVENAQTASPMIDRSGEMDEKSWWDFWNVSYRSQDDGGEIPTELFDRTSAIVARVGPSGGGHVLEIACGAGALSRRLTYTSYYGLDISPAAIDVAREKSEAMRPAVNATTYEAADFHDWLLPPRPFDVTLCVDAVAYFRDQAAALKKMAHSLCPNGVLVLTTINPFVYHRIQRTAKSPLREGAISRWLTKRELHRLIESAGLAVEHSFTIMPRGNLGFLRIVNARRLNHMFGIRGADFLKRVKEQIGLGQYRVVVARKRS
jgi:2-polyprenyl-3-methyl-5-hydroxy-6-metoxy-1,4-benzoquinol methylase